MPDGLDGNTASTPDHDLTDPDKDFRAELGDRIRAQLERTTTSYAELARRVGVTPTTVARYVGGEINMTAAMIGRIAAALGCSTHDLVPADEAVA